jgi:hypothetical protein
MQAIFVVGFFVVKKGKCAGMAPPHRATLVLSASKLRGRVGRGTRPIVARKKIAIGVSIGALDFMSRGVEKFPPSSYGELVMKIASLDIQRESQTRDDRSDDRFWLERKGKAVTGFHWLDSREMPKEGISTIEIESQSRRERFRVDNLAHEPPARLRIADGKNLFPAEKRRYSPRTFILQHTFFEHHTTTQNKNGLHCLLLHRLRRGPQGDQDPGAHLSSVTPFPAVRSGHRLIYQLSNLHRNVLIASRRRDGAPFARIASVARLDFIPDVRIVRV